MKREKILNQGWMQCPKCKKCKKLCMFPDHSSRPLGKYPGCKPCKAAYMRESTARWKSSNPKSYKESQKRTNLKKKYGITLEFYQELLAYQGGLCAICGVKPDWLSLAVDHCHKSLKIRGLLCTPCNLGLGGFQDDADRLDAAAKYIRAASY